MQDLEIMVNYQKSVREIINKKVSFIHNLASLPSRYEWDYADKSYRLYNQKNVTIYCNDIQLTLPEMVLAVIHFLDSVKTKVQFASLEVYKAVSESELDWYRDVDEFIKPLFEEILTEQEQHYFVYDFRIYDYDGNSQVETYICQAANVNEGLVAANAYIKSQYEQYDAQRHDMTWVSEYESRDALQSRKISI